MQQLKLYNSLTRQISTFSPIHPNQVGIYICGPTVYGYPHLGHVRGPIVFDVLHRYLKHLGYKVRLVRNITDVGHLINDADDGEDKIAKRAKLEQLEPMEVAHYYTMAYHEMIEKLNVLPASIEPRASGHIIEQIEMIQQIIANGYAYEKNGSVYFDVLKYNKNNNYGELSGRKIEELIAGAGNESRALEGQDEKKSPNDFALWKKAGSEHIMQWNSPWGMGFPGWHIECSAMSKKYLGNQFDIHGGGMDLLFPHHESEIAQSMACNNTTPAKLWMHHNMVTINGQKMAKSLNNGISVKEFFSGTHPLLNKAYSANTLKFFILQAHYRGTLDFSNDALLAAEKGLARLIAGFKNISNLPISSNTSIPLNSIYDACYEALNEDLNTPIVISHLFELVSHINQIAIGKETITETDRNELGNFFYTLIFDILGLEQSEDANPEILNKTISLLLNIRQEAKLNKNYALADEIRNELLKIGIEIKDSKEGITFNII